MFPEMTTEQLELQLYADEFKYCLYGQLVESPMFSQIVTGVEFTVVELIKPQEVTQLEILVEELGVIVIGVPTGIPGTVDAEAKPDRIDFLTHDYAFSSPAVSSRSRTMTVRLLNGLTILPTRPRARARQRFIMMALPT